jgi:esterase/lipase superfamily enzyme
MKTAPASNFSKGAPLRLGVGVQPNLLVYGMLFFICALVVDSALVHSQSSTNSDALVKQSLFSLIGELQSKISRQAAGDQSAYVPQGPINPALNVLGRPMEILLSDPVVAQGLLNFNGRVTHEYGMSEWSLGALDTGQIVTYAFTISYAGLPAHPFEPNNYLLNPGQITGGPNSVINNPGQIAGGPNSVFNNPSPIWGGHNFTFSWGGANVVLGQQAAPVLPPKPPSPPIPTNPVPPAPPVVDPRVVEFLFASTREAVVRSSLENISYSGERGPLTFGAASVRIPDDHKIGRIELPSSWSLFGITLFTPAANEHDHFIIKRVVPLSPDLFDKVIKAKDAKTALIFVHGFNNTFEDALYRNAQIVWDLQYTGLSVLFTWASRGHVEDYIYDRESALLARQAFIELLQRLKNEYGIEQINVLAHSMGNLIALDALANYAHTSNPIQIARLIMAAPDVDRDQFEALAPMAKTIVGDMTLYASEADRTLALSRRLAGDVPRAGDVPVDGPVILPHVETIDVTAVGDDIFGLNHDVFAGSRDVLEDISVLLRSNLPPPRLAQIRPVPNPPQAPRYWRFVP